MNDREKLKRWIPTKKNWMIIFLGVIIGLIVLTLDEAIFGVDLNPLTYLFNLWFS